MDNEKNLERAIDRLVDGLASNTAAQQELKTIVQGMQQEVKDTYVRKDVLVPTLKAMSDDIDSNSDWIRWATRIVLALVIAAVVGLVLASGGAK